MADQLELGLFAHLFDEPLDSPPPVAAAPVKVDTRAHVWIVAAEIKVEDRIAKVADFRGPFTTTAGTRVDALEVYCRKQALSRQASGVNNSSPSSQASARS